MPKKSTKRTHNTKSYVKRTKPGVTKVVKPYRAANPKKSK